MVMRWGMDRRARRPAGWGIGSGQAEQEGMAVGSGMGNVLVINVELPVVNLYFVDSILFRNKGGGLLLLENTPESSRCKLNLCSSGNGYSGGVRHDC